MKSHILFLSVLISFLTGVCTKAEAAAKAGDATVKVGSTTTVSLAATYQNTLKRSTVSSYRWSTSSSNITVTSQSAYSCTIKGVTAGTAQLNYYCSYWIDGYYRTMDFYYTVKIESSTATLTISPTSITLDEGDTYSVTAYQPGYVGGVYFTTSNSNIASVSTSSNSGYYTYGTVTAVSAGTAYIYAKSANGASSTACTVTVKAKEIKPTGISLPASKTIEEGEYAYLTATVSPSNATYTLSWSSSDTDVATVSSSGRVYGKSAGTANITAKINGYSLSDYCTVTVKAKQVVATSINVEGPELLNVGDTYQLTPTYSPTNATTSFQFASSNAEVVTVSPVGLITATGAGTAQITVTETVSKLSAKVDVEVTVKEEMIEVTDVSQLPSAIYIKPLLASKGSTVSLSVSLKNASAATAYVFDLELPEGVTVATNENGKYIDALSDRHTDHTRTFNYKGDNVYSLAALSGNSEELTGNDGVIRTVKLNIDNELAEGIYAIKVTGASYSQPDGTQVTLPATTTTITVSDCIPGDVNGNGAVDIGDAVSIVNLLVGKESSTFTEKAADTNKNGHVDIGDAVTIINLLVGKIESFSRSVEVWNESEAQ